MMTVNLQVAITFDETTCGKFVELIRLGIASGNIGLATALVDVVKPATVKDCQSVGVVQHAATQQAASTKLIESTAGREAKLIDAVEVSRLIGMSARTVWRLKDAGKMPKPVSIGRRVRWQRAEIDEWITAGCPSLVKWKSMAR